MDYRIELLRHSLSELDERIKAQEQAGEVQDKHAAECRKCSEAKGMGYFCADCPDRMCSMCKTYDGWSMAHFRWEQRCGDLATWAYVNAASIRNAMECYIKELSKKPEV